MPVLSCGRGSRRRRIDPGVILTDTDGIRYRVPPAAALDPSLLSAARNLLNERLAGFRDHEGMVGDRRPHDFPIHSLHNRALSARRVRPAAAKTGSDRLPGDPADSHPGERSARRRAVPSRSGQAF